MIIAIFGHKQLKIIIFNIIFLFKETNLNLKNINNIFIQM